MFRHLFSRALLIGALAAAASAQSLTGHIVDYNGNPVNNVNVILSNGAPLGTTDPAGNFTITGLRNRVYTIQLDPHNNLLDAQQFDFSVSGAANLGTITLQRAWQVSARCVGPTGAPLLGVNMNAYIGAVKLYTPHDGTDALGNVDIGAPANTLLRIRALPPVGSGLAPFERIMTLTASVDLGTITMPLGYAGTGTVTDKINNLPIAGCEIITTNMITGEIVPQINKLTTALGGFSLVLPFGVYQLDIQPPLGNLHTGRQLMGLPIITGGFNFGIVGLDRGFLMSGQITGPGGPVNGADIDVYTTDGYKLFTPNEHTNASGVFQAVVPPGTYSIRVDPLVSSGLVGTHVGNYTITTNQSVGVISLAAGVPMNFDITDYNGAPVSHANVNLTNPATGAQIIITGDFSDANGHVNGIAPLGTWNMTIDAPQGSTAAKGVYNNVVISGPLTTSRVLARKSLRMDLKVFAPGIIASVPNGSVLPIDWTFQNLDAINHPTIIDGVAVLPDGSELPWVPFIGIDFLAGSGITLQFNLPMPIVPANQLGRIQRFEVRFRDPSNLAILERAFIQWVPL